MADGQGPANALLFIVLLLWGVPLSLFASVLSLHQFKVLYGLLANLSQKRYKNNVWRSARPYLKTAVGSIEAAFGPAADYKPSSTQVVMVALMIVIIISVERIIVNMQCAQPSKPSSAARR